jgi:hypothetical protein
MMIFKIPWPPELGIDRQQHHTQIPKTCQFTLKISDHIEYTKQRKIYIGDYKRYCIFIRILRDMIGYLDEGAK